MHVLFRCDATEEGGIGHLVRVVSVADAAVNAGHSVCVAGDIQSPLARQLVEEAQLTVVPAPGDLGALAAEHGASIVHVDDYTVGNEALEQVRAAGALLSSMEDGSYGRRDADLVVDSTIGAEFTERGRASRGRVLRGIAYAPMRPQVLAARHKREHDFAPSPVPRALIVMGGTDATGAAATIAGLCAGLPRNIELTVIAPTRHWEAVAEAAGPSVQLLEPTPAFLEIASTMDFVVSASGTSAWELACIGVPTLLVAVVDNQKAGYAAALDAGIAKGLGTIDKIRAHRAQAAAQLDSFVEALAAGAVSTREAMAKVDGRGAERIVEAWTTLFDERFAEKSTLARDAAPSKTLTVRDASMGDCLHLLRWRNDPETRAVSRTTEAIGLDAHAPWLERTLERHDRELFIAQVKGRPVGMVRFDADGSAWEVSINLAPETRGRGLARKVLSEAESLFFRRHPGSSVMAFVRAENAPSMRLFDRAGYEPWPDRNEPEFAAFVKSDPS
ncbi:bifunctional UDP-2,4-diacetamido-2,4,6-trideoxy-beta-L-altropyranose hydrolase/GNAT family N-acetyltransferase [Dermabacter sp. Marseille-Q3180]|uniref:bifunctional UDP-2,4-diacetamido-2,4,6-trideoxy-beta-L-altropyranose hydrolase/GNAT family N-acetyltransferase n=1 Tax=Dermabacter sp. Marseille-Q3180 TaxID=2758090 RepID=UPI0020256484|nr:bifunctional UDP-2,4-diacetamido-2,4,6-trideoxy-beta-L-altropyranose hydrolase/GNAT family N-acetyltransferase [Dermabacter sp. Marseille-Q3180]